MLKHRSSRLILLNLIALAVALTSIPHTRVQAGGELDPSFGDGGKVVTDFVRSGDVVNAVVLQPDGKVVVAGNISAFALARYNPDGSLDNSFGTGGKVITFASGQSGAFDMALQSDGKLVVVGLASGIGFAVARYNTDGSLDLSFGINGIVFTSFRSSFSIAYAVALQPDGKIVVAGEDYFFPTMKDFAVSRYNPDGSLDPTFGAEGKVIIDFFGQTDTAFDVAIQPDSKIVLAGTAFKPTTFYDFALARLNGDGTLDSSFGSGGKVTTDFIRNSDLGQSMLIQADGKLVVAGSGDDFYLARYQPNGVLDATFGIGGKVRTDFFGLQDLAYAVALTPDQKLVVAGSTTSYGGTQQDFAVARYNLNGSLDPTFGIGGKMTTDFGGYDIAFAVAVQPDNKIIAAGYTAYYGYSSPPDFAIARYNGTGFSFCVQDESNGNVLRLDTATGDYLLTNCAGLNVGGTGTLTSRGSLITLQHTSSDRRVTATIDTATGKATASIQLLSQGRTFSITDRNINNNTCACR